MKRLVIGENVDLSNLVLGGYVVNTETIKKRFDIKKGALKYNLVHVNDVYIIMRRTAKTINYDMHEGLQTIYDDGYIVTDEIGEYLVSQEQEWEVETDEPVQEENGIKKFSELDLDGMDKSKRVKLSQLEIRNVVLAENDEISCVLFESEDGYYVPVEDTTEALGYSVLKIEEDFEFDLDIKSESIEGVICDLGKSSIKEMDTVVFVNGLKLEFNKQKFDEIYELIDGNKTTRVYRKDLFEHKVTKLSVNGITIYTYIATEGTDVSSYKLLFKAYKSTKKSAGITSKRFNKLESFLRY